MKVLVGVFCLISVAGAAQQFEVSGTVSDSTDRSTLVGVTVILRSQQDTTRFLGTVTDVAGSFNFSATNGSYLLTISYIGYGARKIPVTVRNGSVNLGNVAISQSVTTLKAVQIEGTAIQMEQKGDTLQYNANAFKTSRDAMVEDLIKKMPGMTSDNGGLKAQGEAVQLVLVDGKEFFGDDASMALKNLPAEIVEKIEVFDRLSEQAQQTGFDDGQTRKTVNIVTKRGTNRGQFGRVHAGIGEGGRYLASGNVNSFKGDRRVSLVGLTNNINQQNFSNEDLLGAMGGQPQGGGRGGGGRRGGNTGSFNVGQQNGISTTHSVGLNYSDDWGKKTEVTASYFFNKSLNERLTNLSRLYITPRDSGLVYDEYNRYNAVNYNHRISLRMEHEIDSANSLVFTPRLSFQQNDSRSVLTGRYTGVESDLDRMLDNRNSADNGGYSFSNNLVYRHRFRKRGRSLSIGVNTDINDRSGNSSIMSIDEDQESGESESVDQRSDNSTRSLTVSPNLAYTDQLGKRAQIQVNYTPSYRKSATDKQTSNFDPESARYTQLDTLLSNRFDNLYTSHRGGASFRFNAKKMNFNTSVNVQHARLTSDQEFPYAFRVDRSFSNVLPQFQANYRFTRHQNLRFNYRTSTNAPTVNQLQNVVDNRNPLFLRTGNPALAQDFTHSFTMRFGKTNPDNASSLLLLVDGRIVQNYITNTSLIAASDTVVSGIPLSRGTQLSFPVNINGYRTARTLVTYGMPVKGLRSNLNVNTEFSYNRIPALINGASNLANNFGMSQGIVLSSNISENLDFTLSYSAGYNVVKNTLQKQSDNNYFNGTGAFRLNWVFWKGFSFSSNVNNTIYRGLSAEFDRSIWLWNASLGYKFLKDRSLEVKVNAFDILNRNNSITRDISETFIEDRQTNVLTRYFMLMATYRLSRFN